MKPKRPDLIVVEILWSEISTLNRTFGYVENTVPKVELTPSSSDCFLEDHGAALEIDLKL